MPVLLAVCSFAQAPRNDRWKVIGPPGGGSIYAPTISPHNVNDMLAYCDMTGAYISHDGAWNDDLSIYKHFKIGEKVDLRFSADAFNALNHPNDMPPNSTTGLQACPPPLLGWPVSNPGIAIDFVRKGL